MCQLCYFWLGNASNYMYQIDNVFMSIERSWIRQGIYLCERILYLYLLFTQEILGLWISRGSLHILAAVPMWNSLTAFAFLVWLISKIFRFQLFLFLFYFSSFISVVIIICFAMSIICNISFFPWQIFLILFAAFLSNLLDGQVRWYFEGPFFSFCLMHVYFLCYDILLNKDY